MSDWLPELEFIPPIHFRQIAAAIHYITGHLEGLILLEGPIDDGNDSEFAEDTSIKVKHQKSPSKTSGPNTKRVKYIQNETRVSQPLFALLPLSSLTLAIVQ